MFKLLYNRELLTHKTFANKTNYRSLQLNLDSMKVETFSGEKICLSSLSDRITTIRVISDMLDWDKLSEVMKGFIFNITMYFLNTSLN